MKNFVQRGETVTAIAPVGGVVSGSAVLIGALFGVAAISADQGEEFELVTEGVFTLPKAAVDIAAGDPIYWDAAAAKVTNVAAGNTLVGTALAAAASGVATATVRLSAAFGDGGVIRQHDATISSAQLLALNAAPQTILPAPGAGRANIFEGALLYKPAGTAYGGIASGEDLAIKYTDASGLEVGECETIGFLDQATAQFRFVRPHNAATGISSIVPAANAALVMHLLAGEITTGDSDLKVRVFYRTVPSAL